MGFLIIESIWAPLLTQREKVKSLHGPPLWRKPKWEKKQTTLGFSSHARMHHMVHPRVDVLGDLSNWKDQNPLQLRIIRHPYFLGKGFWEGAPLLEQGAYLEGSLARTRIIAHISFRTLAAFLKLIIFSKCRENS